MENTIILKGNVEYLGFGKTKKDAKDKYRLTIKLSNKAEVIEAIKSTFANCPLKPTIVTDENCDIVNVRSLFAYPVKVVDMKADEDMRNSIVDIADFIDYGFTQDAEISIKVKCKVDGQIGAIYPIALKVSKIGSKYDAFADFE